MRRNYYIWAGLLMCLVSNMYASENGGCKLQLRAEESGVQSRNGKPRGTAVIFGDAVTVPAFRLRFVDAKTGRVLRPSKVTLAYGWRWLEARFSRD